MKTRNSHGLLQLGREALAYCQCASALISGNKALFVPVDLIGEKNQVILEYYIKMCKFFSIVKLQKLKQMHVKYLISTLKYLINLTLIFFFFFLHFIRY